VEALTNRSALGMLYHTHTHTHTRTRTHTHHTHRHRGAHPANRATACAMATQRLGGGGGGGGGGGSTSNWCAHTPHTHNTHTHSLVLTICPHTHTHTHTRSAPGHLPRVHAIRSDSDEEDAPRRVRGRPVLPAYQLTNPANAAKLARRRELHAEKRRLKAAQAVVASDPSPCNIAACVAAADSKHGRRCAPELANLGRHDDGGDFAKLRDNAAQLVTSMATDENGNRQRNSHLAPLTGALLKGCTPQFVRDFAGRTPLGPAYLQQVHTQSLTHTHMHTHTRTYTHATAHHRLCRR